MLFLLHQKKLPEATFQMRETKPFITSFMMSYLFKNGILTKYLNFWKKSYIKLGRISSLKKNAPQTTRVFIVTYMTTHSSHKPIEIDRSRVSRPHRHCDPENEPRFTSLLPEDMGVSKNNGTPKYLQIIHFNRVFPYKPSILEYHYFWKHPYVRSKLPHFPSTLVAKYC